MSTDVKKNAHFPTTRDSTLVCNSACQCVCLSRTVWFTWRVVTTCVRRWFRVLFALVATVADVAWFAVRDRRGHVVRTACLRCHVKSIPRQNTIHFVSIHQEQLSPSQHSSWHPSRQFCFAPPLQFQLRSSQQFCLPPSRYFCLYPQRYFCLRPSRYLLSASVTTLPTLFLDNLYVEFPNFHDNSSGCEQRMFQSFCDPSQSSSVQYLGLRPGLPAYFLSCMHL